MTKAPRHPRLAEVAELAGVSISTVSKVINGGTDVGEATRLKVEEILDGKQYMPQRKRTSTPTISLLVRSMTMPSTVEILRGALAEAQAAGVRATIVQHDDEERGDGWIEQFSAKNTSALIAIHSVLDPAQRQRLEEQRVPLIVVNPKDLPNLSENSIGATNWAGGFAATQHLLDLGHRHIAMLAGDEDSMIARARTSGFRDAVGTASVDSVELVHGTFTFESGLACGLEVLSRAIRPTAVFAASDYQAMGVLEAARRCGLRVPEEISVVGFDDLAISPMTAPPLTTVHQPLEQMGAAAITMAVEFINRKSPQSQHIELATSLVVRSSTAARVIADV